MSARPTAAFRVDATAHLGGGHAMRCITLARSLEAKGFTCVFFSKPGFAETVPASSRKNLPLFELRGEDDLPGLLGAKLPALDLLVYDHYGLDAKVELSTRALARCTLVIDDLIDRAHDCDLLLDQTVGRNAASYTGLVPPGCKLLTGAEYCLLRPEFGAARASTLARRAKTDRARVLLITMGLTDVGGVTRQVVEAIGDAHSFEAIHIVVGRGAISLPALEEATLRDARLHLHIAGTVDIAQLMADCDLAIGAAGSTSWERCCLGLPTVMLSLADNQRMVVDELTRRGAAVVASNPNEAAAMAHAMAEDSLERRTMAERAAQLVDGAGAHRAVEAIMSFVAARE